MLHMENQQQQQQQGQWQRQQQQQRRPLQDQEDTNKQPTCVYLRGQQAAQPDSRLQHLGVAQRARRPQKCRHQQALSRKPRQQLVEPAVLQQHSLYTALQLQQGLRRLPAASATVAGARHRAAAARQHACQVQQQLLLLAVGVAWQAHHGGTPLLQLVCQPLHGGSSQRWGGAPRAGMLIGLPLAASRSHGERTSMLGSKQHSQQQGRGGQHAGGAQGRRHLLPQCGHSLPLTRAARNQLLLPLLQQQE